MSSSSLGRGGAWAPIAVKGAAARLAALGPDGPSLTARRPRTVRRPGGIDGELRVQVADHAPVDDVGEVALEHAAGLFLVCPPARALA